MSRRPRFTIWSFGRNLRTAMLGDPTGASADLRAITTTLAQTSADWEMLIVDDASDDGTADWLAPQATDPRIRVVTNAERRGKLANFIDHFAEFRGDIAVELDADDSWATADGLAMVDGCYGSDGRIEATVGRWIDPHNSTTSGNIHSVVELRPRPLGGADALRTFSVPMMRRAMAAYPGALVDPLTGQLWASAADAAIQQLALHAAHRVVDLGAIVYRINDHNHRDHRLGQSAQWNATTRILEMWAFIKAHEAEAVAANEESA